MAKGYIRTEYGTTVVLSNIRKGKASIPVIGMNDSYTATKVTTWWDGSPMTPEKADGSVYLMLTETGEYFRVNLPNDGELFLEKDTVDDLRAINPIEVLLLRMSYYKGVKLNGYYQAGDTPAPIEYYLSDTAEEDDGGSIFEVGTIKLEHEFVGEVDVRYFGAKGDYINITSYTDNTTAIQSASNYLARYKTTARTITFNNTLIVPSCDSGSSFGFGCSGELTFNGSFDILCKSPLIRVGDNRNDGDSFITFGEYSDTERIYYSDRKVNLWARSSPLMWEEKDYKGISIYNLQSSDIVIQGSYGFDVGVGLYGYNNGFSINKVSFYNIRNNRKHVDIKSYSSPLLGDSSGYVTSCIFYNYGRIGNDSNVSTQPYDRTGIEIGHIGGTGYTPESLTFNSGCIEGLIHENTPSENIAIPVNIINGSKIVFNNFRHESNFRIGESPAFMRVVRGDSNSAELTIVVPSGTIGEWVGLDTELVQDLSSAKQGNYVTSRTNIFLRDGINRRQLIFDSGLFKDIHVPYDNNNQYNVQGFGSITSSGAIRRFLPPNSAQQSYSIDSDGYLNIPLGGGMFMDVDTVTVKRLAITPDTDTINSLRLFYYCYDDLGNVLNPIGNIFGVLSSPLNTYGSNGRADYQEVELNLRSRTRFISLSENVKKVRIIMSGLTNSKVRSLRIVNIDGVGSSSNVSPYKDLVNYAITPPATGSFNKGRIVINNTSGSSIYGWVATSDGIDDVSIWKPIPVGEFVSSEGAFLSPSNGGQLVGDLNAGSMVYQGVTSGVGYPTTNGATYTYNGTTFERCFSIFTTTSTINKRIWIQLYDNSGLGLGWIAFATPATPTEKGLVNQAVAVPNGSSIDDLLAALRTAGILAT